MATWGEVTHTAPAFAEAVRARFDAHRHKVLATLRRDGAPRLSGIEAAFVHGDLWMAMMPGSQKARDLQRDPRLAVHSASEDPPAWRGDAKVSGRAVEITDPERVTAVLGGMGAGDDAPPGPVHLFRIDVTEAVLTRLGDPPDHLVIELWREGEGLRHMERS
ncbi:MAG: pyridoxamine 5'-phosphate oxidase family protein [Actinomycetota bacterium]|nr:pyridoxamine 5'-phosphate oxidase family protein [Actinomycetota bacterium]